MYTELEKFIAIRQIIDDYRVSQLADYQDYQQELTKLIEAINIDQKTTNKMVNCALDLQNAEAEYCYAKEVLVSMDAIFSSGILPQKDIKKEQIEEEKVCKKLNKHATDTAYSYILSNVAYELFSNNWFPFPVAESVDPLVLSKQTETIFSYQDMDRETKIMYNILQLALANSTEFKKEIPVRRFHK